MLEGGGHHVTSTAMKQSKTDAGAQTVLSYFFFPGTPNHGMGSSMFRVGPHLRVNLVKNLPREGEGALVGVSLEHGKGLVAGSP